MVKYAVITAFILSLSACAVPVSCVPPEKDGGIGGTGDCSVQTPPKTLKV